MKLGATSYSLTVLVVPRQDCGPLDLGDGLVDALGHVVDVGGGEAAHGDAPRAQQVDVPLLHQPLRLGRGEARVAEHPDLGDISVS